MLLLRSYAQDGYRFVRLPKIFRRISRFGGSFSPQLHTYVHISNALYMLAECDVGDESYVRRPELYRHREIDIA